jgi:hypothetical protein
MRLADASANLGRIGIPAWLGTMPRSPTASFRHVNQHVGYSKD